MFMMLKWAVARLKCSLLGHQLTPGRFFYGPSASVQNGYCCERCGKTQLLLYRWQSVADA